MGIVVEDIAIDVVGLGSDFGTGQIGHSAATDSSTQRRFFEAVLLKR